MYYSRERYRPNQTKIYDPECADDYSMVAADREASASLRIRSRLPYLSWSGSRLDVIKPRLFRPASVFYKCMSRNLGIIFILMLLICDSSRGDESSCSNEANRIYDRLFRSQNFGADSEIDTAMLRLKQLGSKGCFAEKDLKESFYILLYDPTTGVFDEKVEAARKAYWNDEEDFVKFVREKTPGELPAANRAFMTQFQRVRPEGISPTAIQQLSRIAPAQANASCATVDSIVKRMPPVRDQGETGWCDFFSTADLLSFKTGQTISASYLGHLLSPTGEGGSDTAAINKAIGRFGLCREKTMPSNGIMRSYVDELKDLNDRARRAKLTGADPSCFFADGILGRFPTQNLRDLTNALLQGVDDKGSIVDLQIASTSIGEKDFTTQPSIVQHLALKQCEGDRALLAKMATAVHLESLSHSTPRAQRFQKIDELLTKGQPINIAYDFDSLIKGDKSISANHWSTVVGRKMIGGSCKYLVRNSWGASSCTEATSGRPTCEPPGYFYVDGTKLYGVLEDVQYAD